MKTTVTLAIFEGSRRLLMRRSGYMNLFIKLQ